MRPEAYRATAEHEASHWWFRSRRELILAQLEQASDSHRRSLRILDYGCGTGYNLPLLARFGEAHGTDLDDEALRVLQLGPASAFIASHELPAYEGQFDLVTAFDVIEHLDDDVGALRGIAKLLAEDTGQVLLTVPAHPALWSDEDVISLHRRRYTARSLAEVCRRAGFQIRFLSHFNVSVLPLQALYIWGRRALRAGYAVAGLELPLRTHLAQQTALFNELLFRATAWEARRVGAERMRPPAGGSLVCRLSLGAAE